MSARFSPALGQLALAVCLFAAISPLIAQSTPPKAKPYVAPRTADGAG
jgi:hypothetical protein